jgi:prepilin-type processing-associated H-X9-DG protein
MKSLDSSRRKAAFTLVELLGAVLGAALVASVLTPLLTQKRHGCGYRIRCTNNLKQIGMAFRLFATDNNDLFPMSLSTNEGGTKELARTVGVYRHFQVMSNELNSPRILMCRQDTRKEANSFSSLGNSNISYFVGLRADETKPNTLLAGDRSLALPNFTPAGGSLLVLRSNSLVSWSKAIHNEAGNVALGDGSVQNVSTTRLREQLGKSEEQVTRLRLP